MIGTLLTFLVVGIAALVAASLVLWVVGAIFSITMGIAGFLLFKVAPILLVGWIAVKVFQKVGNRRQLSSNDRRWLEGD
jgi:hypothetical protein